MSCDPPALELSCKLYLHLLPAPSQFCSYVSIHARVIVSSRYSILFNLQLTKKIPVIPLLWCTMNERNCKGTSVPHVEMAIPCTVVLTASGNT